MPTAADYDQIEQAAETVASLFAYKDEQIAQLSAEKDLVVMILMAFMLENDMDEIELTLAQLEAADAVFRENDTSFRRELNYDDDGKLVSLTATLRDADDS